MLMTLKHSTLNFQPLSPSFLVVFCPSFDAAPQKLLPLNRGPVSAADIPKSDSQAFVITEVCMQVGHQPD